MFIKRGNGYKDHVGERYNKLIIVKDTGKRYRDKKVVWECKCDCGNIVYARFRNLFTGNTKSCGCLNKIVLNQRRYRSIWETFLNIKTGYYGCTE